MSVEHAGSARMVLLTGVTGFLGQAVLLALLERSDDIRVAAIIRPRDGQTAADRLAEIVDKPVFSEFRRRHGQEAARRIFDSRTVAVAGDLATLATDSGPFSGLQGIDTVVHCASAVSFDLPIDEAFNTNVGGSANLYAALHAAGLDCHVVHVSTAYVGGAAKGLRLEGSLAHNVDWRVEFEAALQARRDVEAESRTPAVLNSLLSQARSSHGKQGPKQVADTAEALRHTWVDDRLSEAGRLRAESLGWTDIYTFTKAMAERVAEQEWSNSGHRLSVVRPSIIESAVSWPSPGWIDGYKVADPLIIAYGKGHLPNFPALPDTVLDVIPVDFVVNAITALVIEDVDRSGDDAYYQVVSGSGNPLPFHKILDTIRSYFLAHPMTNEGGGDIPAPEWTYPHNGAVSRRFARLHLAARAASSVVSRLPSTPRTRQLATRLHKQRTGLGQLRKYIDLYQHYTRTEMIFDDANTRALLAAVPEKVRRTAGFDVTTIDWYSYLHDQHLPAIVALTEEHSAAKAARRAARAQAQLPTIVPGHKVLAVFDLDGTVLNSNIVRQYLAVQRGTLPVSAWPRELASLLAHTPQLLRAERRDRAEFIRMFARRYAGLRVDELRTRMSGPLGEAFRRSVMADAAAQIKRHRDVGHRTVLVTGVFDLLVEPIADMFDEVVAGEMHVRDSVMTGYLATPPLVAEARANWLLKYAGTGGYDLELSHAYGDSHADASWIELVGHPHAVNPDLQLYSVAQRRKWTIEDWS
ncbi:SDR family oxidoreductase [Arthrobacter pigmenti]